VQRPFLLIRPLHGSEQKLLAQYALGQGIWTKTPNKLHIQRFERYDTHIQARQL
jgi:hypothetical protein